MALSSASDSGSSGFTPEQQEWIRQLITSHVSQSQPATVTAASTSEAPGISVSTTAPNSSTAAGNLGEFDGVWHTINYTYSYILAK